MADADALVVHLDGFEGPLDLLLELARQQKVDLARISILALVEQFLTVIDGVRLELAADWLVMAAWLTWLKSRLLLPPGTADAEQGEEAATMLAARLHELQQVRDLVSWLGAQPQLGHEVFARGAPETLVAIDQSALAADVPGLLHGYLAARRRAGSRSSYVPNRPAFWTVADALDRLARMLGRVRAWTALELFLPEAALGPLQRRAALASTLLAGLELARGGVADLRQDRAFAPILMRAP